LSSSVEINNISFDKEKCLQSSSFTIGIESVKVNFRMYLSEENFWEISNIINVPNADGSSEEYRVFSAQILHPDLAKKMQT
jgi:hypothetical protein